MNVGKPEYISIEVKDGNTYAADRRVVACAGLLDALGSLMSEWTGEVVRVRMTAEGQPDVLDMVKRPSAAGAPH